MGHYTSYKLCWKISDSFKVPPPCGVEKLMAWMGIEDDVDPPVKGGS